MSSVVNMLAIASVDETQMIRPLLLSLELSSPETSACFEADRSKSKAEDVGVLISESEADDGSKAVGKDEAVVSGGVIEGKGRGGRQSKGISQ